MPEERLGLTMAEKMLIQRASLFVPLQHVKDGTMAIQGHVCCFPQNIDSICSVLPRIADDVKIIRFLKDYKDVIFTM